MKRGGARATRVRQVPKQTPIEIWREKREHLERELAIAADPEKKFELRKLIGEANHEIARLSRIEFQKPRLLAAPEQVVIIFVPVVVLVLLLAAWKVAEIVFRLLG